MASGSGERPRDAATLRVLLVDDHAFYRAGLRGMLAGEGFDVAEARSGPAAIERVAASPPDVVLMDLHMPEMSGVEATRRLGDTVPVLMLTVSTDDHDVVEAVRAGARGYLLKDAPLEEIVAGIRVAAAGETWVSSRVARALVAPARESEAARTEDPAVAALSGRELDVLRLLAAGKDNAAIGSELYISAGTVRKNVSSILAKLGVENRVEAAVYAVRRGLA